MDSKAETYLHLFGYGWGRWVHPSEKSVADPLWKMLNSSSVIQGPPGNPVAQLVRQWMPTRPRWDVKAVQCIAMQAINAT